MDKEDFNYLSNSESHVLDNAANILDNLDYMCKKCARFNQEMLNCEAFPDGIPHVLYAGIVRHTKPMFTDRGLLFKMKGE